MGSGQRRSWNLTKSKGAKPICILKHGKNKEGRTSDTTGQTSKRVEKYAEHCKKGRKIDQKFGEDFDHKANKERINEHSINQPRCES